MTYASWSVVFGEQPSAAKWNILGTNDAFFEDFIIGTNGVHAAWTAFTPSWTNITTGNGTHSGRYIKLGTTVFFRVRFTMGSTSSMGTDPALTLPVTASSNYTSTFHIIGTGHIQDYGTNSPMACMRITNTTTANLYCYNSSSTYLLLGGINSTTPMTWTTNDSFDIQGMYEAAS